MTVSDPAFDLVMCEVETGIVLKEDGSRYLRGQERFRPTFATIAEAEVKRDELLRQFPFAGVWINLSGEASKYKVSSDWDEYSKERTVWRAWHAYFNWQARPWFVRMWFKKPPKTDKPDCRYFKPERLSAE